jgi:hypothetical protein
MTTIETRFLDAEGETLDIATHATIAEAKADLPAITSGAWVMERRTVYAATGRPDSYKLIASGGDCGALRAAGF